MKYCCTFINEFGDEIVHTVLPLSTVSSFDPNNPHPQTYGCPDWVEKGYKVSKTADGVSFSPYTLEESQRVQLAKKEAKMQVHRTLDAVAYSFGYTDAASMSKYASLDPNMVKGAAAKYREEALTFIHWTAEVWDSFFLYLESVSDNIIDVGRCMPEITVNGKTYSDFKCAEYDVTWVTKNATVETKPD